MIFEAKTGFRAAFTLFQSPFFCFPDVKMAHILVSFSLFLALQEKVKKLGTGGFEPKNHENTGKQDRFTICKHSNLAFSAIKETQFVYQGKLRFLLLKSLHKTYKTDKLSAETRK